jgi:hypothetical protein
MINYAVAAAKFAKAPGWRPSFKYWSPWLGMLGAALCLAAMMMVDYITGVVTLLFCFGLFKYVEYTKPNVNWGSADEGIKYERAKPMCHCQTFAHRHVNAIQALFRLESAKVRCCFSWSGQVQ